MATSRRRIRSVTEGQEKSKPGDKFKVGRKSTTDGITKGRSSGKGESGGRTTKKNT